MASLSILYEDGGCYVDVDYSVQDGSIHSFQLDGRILFDENESMQDKNWKTVLIDLIKEEEWDIDDGRGLHAFVYPLLKDIRELEGRR